MTTQEGRGMASPPSSSSLAALLANLAHLDDEQLHVLIGQAQGILLDRVAAEQVPPLSIEIVDREEECILRAYRSLAPSLRSRVLHLSAVWASRAVATSRSTAAAHLQAADHGRPHHVGNALGNAVEAVSPYAVPMVETA